MANFTDLVDFLKENWKVIAAFLSILFVILLVLYLIMALFAMFITWYGSWVLLLTAIFLTARKIARFMIFPGHCSFFKRSVEYRVGKSMANKVIGQILEHRYAVDVFTLSVVNFEKVSNLLEINNNTYQMILSIEYTVDRQKELGTLSEDQENLLSKIQVVKQALAGTICEIEGTSKNLWELGPTSHITYESFQSDSFNFEDISQVRRLVKTFTEFCESFQDLVPFSDYEESPQIPVQTQVRSFLSNTTFGSINQMRVELETQYGGVQISLPADDGKTIDCMFIPAVTDNEDADLPTIIYCPPNAMLYEVLLVDDEWLHFYRDLGINLFVWNYRGYGRSQGNPNPAKIYEDAELIVEYLRSQTNFRISQKIGAHGQSLGGAVAAHLARHCALDFLLIDRSFSSIDSVVKASYGKLAFVTLKVLSLFSWNFDTTENYIYANTYKVIASDPNDDLIPDCASLKNGVTKSIIFSEAQRKENRITIGPNKRREKKNLDFETYSHIINKEETKGFFDALKYLYRQMLTYASSESSKRSRKSNLNEELKQMSSEEANPSSEIFERNSPDTERSMAENELLQTEESFANETLDITNGLNMTYEDTETNTSDENHDINKRMKKEQKKRERREKFKKFDDIHDPTDYDVFNSFLLRTYKNLHKLDSGGRTLRQVFELPENEQFEAFKIFIMNLEIYGSFLPINDRMHDAQVTRISSYLKISKIRKSLDFLINEFESVEGRFFKEFWLKTRMASYYFNKLEAFLSRKHKQSSHKRNVSKGQFCIDYDLENGSEEKKQPFDVVTDFESSMGDNTKNSTPRSGTSVVEDDEDEYYYTKTLFRDFTEPDVMKTGCLIPLSCGHNGVYKEKEKNLLIMHFKESGFI